MSVNSKMTAIADEIRELSGTTGAMGLDAMASTLNAENTNFASNLTTQDNLISQIQTALQNKAAATGEDVTSETNAYTNKLAALETAITALETELQGKASGGSGGGSIEAYSGKISYESLSSTITVAYTDSTLNYTTVTIDSLTNINVVKNTIVFITGGRCNAISGCTRLGGGTGSYAYLITANNFEIQMPV